MAPAALCQSASLLYWRNDSRRRGGEEREGVSDRTCEFKVETDLVSPVLRGKITVCLAYSFIAYPKKNV